MDEPWRNDSKGLVLFWFEHQWALILFIMKFFIDLRLWVTFMSIANSVIVDYNVCEVEYWSSRSFKKMNKLITLYILM